MAKVAPISFFFGAKCIKILMPTQQESALVEIALALPRVVYFLGIAWAGGRGVRRRLARRAFFAAEPRVVATGKVP